jgi:hypothetical protein
MHMEGLKGTVPLTKKTRKNGDDENNGPDTLSIYSQSPVPKSIGFPALISSMIFSMVQGSYL